MNRVVGLFLVAVFACVASGAAEWLHVRLEHPGRLAAHAYDPGHGERFQSAVNHHDDDCVTCMALHAPFGVVSPPRFDLRVERLTRRVLVLQGQRLDASVPAPRGCRGPPV